MNTSILATIVTASPNTAQLFFLIAVIVSIIATFLAYNVKTYWACLLMTTLVFICLGLLFLA